MLVDLNISGGTYRHQSLPLSAQVTRNFWPQKQDYPGAKSTFVLQSFYGLELFGTVAGGVDRGMHEHLGIGYKVTGTTLYSVADDGTHTSLGTIPGTERCLFQGINTSLVLTTEGKAYVWDGINVTEISDVDLETPNSCAHLNNQIVFDGDGGRFVSSTVGDPTDIPALNYATAESDADDLIRVYTYDQQLLLLGDKTTELWYNSGVGAPPFDRIEGGIIQVGLQALHSVASTRNAVYFLGNDNVVYAMKGASVGAVSPLPLTQTIAAYTTNDDAIGFTANLDGNWFYVLTFPSANKTWVYLEGGDWFEWSYGSGGGRSLANSYMYVHGKHLVGDYLSGNIYELKRDVYSDNGEEIIRTRDTAPLHGGMLGAPGRTITMNRFELLMETGVGLLSGQGEDPVVMLSFSDDGGRTFSTEQWGSIGRSGEFMYKVEWFALGSFESRIMRVRISDPVAVSIHSAAAEIEVGI